MSESTFGWLVDIPEQDFRNFCSDKDLGYLLTLLRQIEVEFSHVVDIKDAVISKLLEASAIGEKSEYNIARNNLYAILQRLENRHKLLSGIIEERKAV